MTSASTSTYTAAPSSSALRSMIMSSVPPDSPAGPVTNNSTVIIPKSSIKKIITRIFKRSKHRKSRSGSIQEDTLNGDRSIKSLGTIELDNSNDLNDDDCGFGLYAYEDIDRFHNACKSSNSSFSLDIVRLYPAATASSKLHGLDENSVSSTCSAPDRIPGHEQEQEQACNEVNDPSKASKGRGLTHDSDSDSQSFTRRTAPQDLDTEMEMLSNRLSNLFREGKEQFELGCYEKAWEIQIEALSYVSSFWFETQGQDQDQDQDQQDASLSFFARQDAMIRYELAKITYHETREQSGTSSPAYHIHLSKLHDKVQNARCKVALRNYQYYISQLRDVEESKDRSDLNQVYNKLYILHNLGTLCEKDLHRYKEALGYYNHALRIEETVWRAYSVAQNESKEEIENDCDADDGVGVSAHVKDFAQRRRCTRRKIGRIQHTCLGRFDLALLSSISS
mmetsp:Transcript_11504/g.17265  ORF Transcript_11504/g.17265 Transcript_11504/m.17265 type:complete len:451 (-) Transcript_11504:149-1501(-)